MKRVSTGYELSGKFLKFESLERIIRLPLFMPVYQARTSDFRLTSEFLGIDVDACIVNAFFLYKQRDLRSDMSANRSLKKHIGFHNLVATDSGAFQGLTRKLYLKNRDIVKFQAQIGSDIVSPLDLITPPGDNRSVAERKLNTTNKRIAESLAVAESGVVVGVQQGGRFLDLRRSSNEALMKMQVEYVAIGSLVPFFNRKHNMDFCCTVIKESRLEIGEDIPMHVYGAGDPVELPFLYMAGADIFDSSSYAHYANDGWYMTPYGAINKEHRECFAEFQCPCPVCVSLEDRSAIFQNTEKLKSHNLWIIFDCIEYLRSIGGRSVELESYLEKILSVHTGWFPDSLLESTWENFYDNS